ncbi:zinc-binding dehydrogenase [Olivibacter sp. XZL3]|uniref:zinc-binding dehydrogenase n=1 Tax=Olivibacter sp. XZL3 TaxID=1735116 RepID=UPI0014170369|nr:zinc-binding dehydrogenase [Olivibacter sp. XZL3]
MKAAILKKYGTPEQFHFAELDVPVIKEGEILVRNKASSVNPVDILVRQGKLKLLTGISSGQVIGSDFSGVVVASKSARFKEGDEVFGVLNATKGGAYAELLQANGQHAALKPSTLSHTEAAALPMVALTAWQGLVKDGKIQGGDKVLILGCTGGVGSVAVQIAKAFEAKVSGTCSKEHMEFAKSLGCDRILDYEKEKVPSDEKFDLIFDASGFFSISDYKDNLTSDAMFVSTRGGTDDASGIVKAAKGAIFDKRMRIVVEQPNSADLDKIRELVDSGQLKPVVAQTFLFENVAEAHHYMEKESVVGKVVIEIPDVGLTPKDQQAIQRIKTTKEPNYTRELVATGFIAGLRSMSAPVIARDMILNTTGGQLQSSRLRFLQSPAVSTVLKLLATTEMVADKLPSVPNRIKPLSLVVRAASGATSSAAVAKKTRHSTVAAAIVGGLAAIAATYAMYYVRTGVAKKTKLPDVVLGMMEDALVLAVGAALAQRTKGTT